MGNNSPATIAILIGAVLLVVFILNTGRAMRMTRPLRRPPKPRPVYVPHRQRETAGHQITQ
jgi:hypothetical protein